MRRTLLTLAAACALTLSACGQTGEPTFPGASTSEDGADEAGGGDTTGADEAAGTQASALDCTAPPAPPAEPQSFTQEDLPEPLTGAGTLDATLSTTCGDIVVELFGDQAPQTVASFEFLAEQGYWDDSPCHRLTTQGLFVLQCGDPTGTGRGNPGYGYGIENAPADGIYPPGTLAMARTQDPDSNGGQFFIVYDDTQLPVEGGGYSIFGQVTEGLDIVEAIAAEGGEGGAPDGAPAQPISILSVELTYAG